MFAEDLSVSQLSYLGLYVFLYIAVGFQSVSNMKGDLHIWEYNMLSWWRLWRKNECTSCIFSTALRWEKSVYREISRKFARESKGDQTFQMILINSLVYSNGCCYKRAKLRYYWVRFPLQQYFPLCYTRFSKVSKHLFCRDLGKTVQGKIVCSF